jgi:DNA modification methylase
MYCCAVLASVVGMVGFRMGAHMITIRKGDCRDVLRALPSESVHCAVTSPPYFGLRDYGVAGQIGLEPNIDDYSATMVDVFRQIHRALRKDGTLWLNLGDSYATGTSSPRNPTTTGEHGYWENPAIKHRINGAADGLKAKDLVGIPWRIAFALQADGWYLRQDIIWSKPNPMPESVRDRCTKAHEYLFLLSKSERYYFDQSAIAEEMAESSIERLSQPNLEIQGGSQRVPGKTNGPMKAVGSLHMGETPRNDGERWRLADGGVAPRGTRNKRSVWEVATQPFSGAHFATFPPALIEPCIKAGCQEGGTVLDPFAGAGTTGLVADRLGRNAILIELNPDYAAMIERRISADAGMFAQIYREAAE